MAPCAWRPDKKRTTAGLGLATSVLLSPQNPYHSTAMGLGRLFGRSTSSSSTSRPQGSGNRPPLSPGSSKADYADGPDPYYSPTSKWPSKSYHVDGDDAPPPYRPGKGPDLNDYGTDFKAPPKIRPDAAYPPAPTQVHGPVQSYGEDPLLPLKNYDMVIILDDSGSMMIADNRSGVSRWEQVCDSALPPTCSHATFTAGANQPFHRILGMGRTQNACASRSQIRPRRDRDSLLE